MHLPCRDGSHVLANSLCCKGTEGKNVTCSPPFPPSQCWYLIAVSPRFSATTRSFSLSDWRTARAAIWVYLLYLFLFLINASGYFKEGTIREELSPGGSRHCW